MRTSAILLIVFLGTLASVLPAQAIPTTGHQTLTSPSVIEAAGRCGRHAYYVRGHRNRFGRWVPGHCRPYRHR